MDGQLVQWDSEVTQSESVEMAIDDSTGEAVSSTRLRTLNQSIRCPPLYPKGTGKWGTLLLAYKTLGVVFGGLVTSPLYVFPSMPLKSPTEEDYLGIYCLMFWTLSLIGVVKYANVAIRADDQGEGGTFALYSLLCRNINIGILPTKRLDASSTLPRASLYEGSKKQSMLGIFFERSLIARRVLLFIAILGMCMLIGDGVLTPAISVLSAMDGIRAPFPSVSKSLVEALSAAVLIGLFLLQKFGTSRVSFLFSPIMGTWTLATPMVGIYSILKHYPGIFKAISPHYMFNFFWRNGKEGWLLLSGIILCITGDPYTFLIITCIYIPSFILWLFSGGREEVLFSGKLDVFANLR